LRLHARGDRSIHIAGGKVEPVRRDVCAVEVTIDLVYPVSRAIGPADQMRIACGQGEARHRCLDGQIQFQSLNFDPLPLHFIGTVDQRQ